MTDADRQRLAAILGMLGSEHAGERDAAGLQAEAFRKKHGLTWREMLASQPAAPAPEPQWTPPAPVPEPASPLSPRYEPEQKRTDRLFLNTFTVVVFIAASYLLIAFFGA